MSTTTSTRREHAHRPRRMIGEVKGEREGVARRCVKMALCVHCKRQRNMCSLLSAVRFLHPGPPDRVLLEPRLHMHRQHGAR